MYWHCCPPYHRHTSTYRNTTENRISLSFRKTIVPCLLPTYQLWVFVIRENVIATAGSGADSNSGRQSVVWCWVVVTRWQEICYRDTIISLWPGPTLTPLVLIIPTQYGIQEYTQTVTDHTLCLFYFQNFLDTSCYSFTFLFVKNRFQHQCCSQSVLC